jgi:hypothetical protein
MRYIENLIMTKIAEALIASFPGEVITVSGERGYDEDAGQFNNGQSREEAIKGIVAEVDKFDEAHIFVGGTHADGYGPYVYVILGNGNGGWDVISDYSTSLQETLQPVLDFIGKEGD